MKVTRRELLAMGAGAGLAMGTTGWRTLYADSVESSARIMTKIPSSGELLPAVGIGTNRYRSSSDPDVMTRFRATLEAFHGAGGRVIDTSPNYGDSETVIGEILKGIGNRDEVFMATKVDREDAGEGIARMTRSQQLLGDKPIDLMQVHNLRGTETQLATMKAWKEEGRIRYIGVTSHRPGQYAEMEEIMRRHPLDFIQINYSLAERSAENSLLPMARERGVTVLVNLPFARGRLFKAVNGKALPAWAKEIDCDSWGQVFLKYILSYPAEMLPIPGTTKPHHVIDNMAAARGLLPDKALREQIGQEISAFL